MVVAGLLGGLGCWLVINELIPTGPSLRAAIDRLDSYGGRADDQALFPVRLGRQVSAVAPWLPVPITDLRLLGQDPAGWLAKKVSYGALGLAVAPSLSALAVLGGHSLPWTIPVGGTLVLGGVMFFLPDLVTRFHAKQKRVDFRYALTSYLDLVALERSAGAAPTEALEAAAEIGGGWAFERISAALDQARKASPAALGWPGPAGGRDRHQRARRPGRDRGSGWPGRGHDPPDAPRSR